MCGVRRDFFAMRADDDRGAARHRRPGQGEGYNVQRAEADMDASSDAKDGRLQTFLPLC